MTGTGRAGKPPFSRSLDVGTVGESGLMLTIEADEAERAALATLDGLVALHRFVADLSVVREGRTGIRITGGVRARLRRTCVVTLDEFDTDLEESIDIHALPEREIEALLASRAAARAARADDDAEAPDLPDPIRNGRIDLGALAAEILALGLDPYPKKPGAAFVEPAEEGATVSPFSALARLKDEGGT